VAKKAAGTAPIGRPEACVGGKVLRRTVFLLLAGGLLCLCGCDPLTVHKVTSTIFDGVPSMPPADQYCQDFHEQAVQEELAAAAKKQQVGQKGTASQHPPFADKRCSLCHDKNTESGFVTPADQLCGHCHKVFPRGEYLHGPAAVGACLKCHVPHSSDNPSLLSLSKRDVCISCHKETRVAEAMHAKVVTSGMYCSDCHDPHGGSNRYFLK
jgi:predicted CXXCH cytochrome family protein